MHYLVYNLPYQHNYYIEFMTSWLRQLARDDPFDIWFTSTVAIELMVMESLIND